MAASRVCMFISPGSPPEVWHVRQQTCLQSHLETSSGLSHLLKRPKYAIQSQPDTPQNTKAIIK